MPIPLKALHYKGSCASFFRVQTKKKRLTVLGGEANLSPIVASGCLLPLTLGTIIMSECPKKTLDFFNNFTLEFLTRKDTSKTLKI